MVLYNEKLNDTTMQNAIQAIENCDLLIVGGTSLTVYPASSCVSKFYGENLVIINRDATDYDTRASLVINESLGTVFEEIMKDYE